MTLRSILSYLVGIGLVTAVHGGRASTWDYCECRWASWKSWSDCTDSCFGNRQRTRSVWLKEHKGCDEFSDCASNDWGLAREIDGCNENCQNGGSRTSRSYDDSPDDLLSRYFLQVCSCSPGYQGRCCDTRVSCGTPDDIANGTVSYPHTYYSASVSYTCRPNFILVGGSSSRTCQTTGYWSGSKPRCAYYNLCATLPCKNGATCTNLPDDYTCTCSKGWSGRHCENDVQPLEVSGCPNDQTVIVTTHTHQVQWDAPAFVDPMGTKFEVITNYPKPSFTFPWGDFTVQYVATKLRNGLQTECRFQISIRPTPCDEINIPVGGARLCNGWRTEFGRFCLVACRLQNTIDSVRFSFETIYVCGASGYWGPSGQLPDCDVFMADVADIEAIQPGYSRYSYNSTCTDDAVRRSLQELYISRISQNDGFSEFCTRHADECRPDNVRVDCS